MGRTQLRQYVRLISNVVAYITYLLVGENSSQTFPERHSLESRDGTRWYDATLAPLDHQLLARPSAKNILENKVRKKSRKSSVRITQQNVTTISIVLFEIHWRREVERRRIKIERWIRSILLSQNGITSVTRSLRTMFYALETKRRKTKKTI